MASRADGEWIGHREALYNIVGSESSEDADDDSGSDDWNDNASVGASSSDDVAEVADGDSSDAAAAAGAAGDEAAGPASRAEDARWRARGAVFAPIEPSARTARGGGAARAEEEAGAPEGASAAQRGARRASCDGSGH